MGELAGRTGSANPALQGLRVRVRASVRVRARPCAPVSVRPCVRVSGVLAGRAGREQTPGCRPGVGCRWQGAGAPPLHAAPFPGLRGWPLRRAAAESAPRPPSRAAQGAGGGRPSSGPAGHFNVAPSSHPPCVSSQLPPWASGK